METLIFRSAWDSALRGVRFVELEQIVQAVASCEMQRDYVLIMLLATALIVGMQLCASRNQTIDTVPVATPLEHAINVAPFDGCEWGDGDHAIRAGLCRTLSFSV